MQARYYDPVIGRFYGVDPVGFSNVHNFNRYAYANNNPYKYTDPDGQAAQVALRAGWVAGGTLNTIAFQVTGVTLSTMLANIVWDAMHNEDASGSNETDAPDGLVGDQSDPRAGPSRGKRWNSGPLTPENDGTGDPDADFDGPISEGQGGKHSPDRPTGSRTAPNGATIRPGKEGEGPRIDIPAKGNTPPETLHYPEEK